MPLTWGAVTGGSWNARIKFYTPLRSIASFRQLGRSIDRRSVMIDDLAVDGIGFRWDSQLCTNGYLYIRNISNVVLPWMGCRHPVGSFDVFQQEMPRRKTERDIFLMFLSLSLFLSLFLSLLISLLFSVSIVRKMLISKRCVETRVIKKKVYRLISFSAKSRNVRKHRYCININRSFVNLLVRTILLVIQNVIYQTMYPRMQI